MYSMISLICKDQSIYWDLSCFQSIHIPSFDSFHIQMIHIKIENTCIGNTFASINHLNIDSQYEWYHITNSYSSMKSFISFSFINRISPHLENSFIQSIYNLSNSSSINPSFPFIWVSYDVHLHWFQYLIRIWYLRINNRMDWINTKWFQYGMSEMFKWIKKYHIQHIV